MTVVKKEYKCCGRPLISLKVLPLEYSYKPFCYSEKSRRFAGLCEQARQDLDEKELCSCVSACASELIDSADPEDFAKTAEALTSLRDKYGSKSTVLGRSINEWLFDFCLLCGRDQEAIALCCGGNFLSPFGIDRLIGNYLTDFISGTSGDATYERLLSALPYMSSYDFKQSHYYCANRKTFDDAFCAVVPALLGRLSEMQEETPVIPKAKSIRRTAYRGLMCKCESSGTLEISYVPYSENTALHNFLGDALQYTENLVRQGLGIRTKLPSVQLSGEYKKLCSDTLREAFPGFLPAPAKVGRKPKKHSDVEKCVKAEICEPEPISLDIDFSRAKQLENDSWKLASLLGGDYGEADLDITVERQPGAVSVSADKGTDVPLTEGEDLKDGTVKNGKNPEFIAGIPEDWREFYSLLSENEIAFLRCIARGGDADALARSLGGMAPGFAGSVNEKAMDSYGDIVLETLGGSIFFPEDYRDELCGIFLNIQ